jgi:hypothetical protein
MLNMIVSRDPIYLTLSVSQRDSLRAIKNPVPKVTAKLETIEKLRSTKEASQASSSHYQPVELGYKQFG